RRGHPLHAGRGYRACRRRPGIDPAGARRRLVQGARRGGRHRLLHHSMLDMVGHTPLVEIAALSPKPAVHLYAKLEGQNPTGSVKDRIAKFMIESGAREGRLRPGQTILEPTSGNTGIALAMIGSLRGYPVKVVMPDAVSNERIELLRAFGAEVIFSPGDLGTNGSVAMAKEVAAAHPDWFM